MRHNSTARPEAHSAVRSPLSTGNPIAGRAELREQWNASQRDIAESVQILEALFQKFDVDPALASELGTALTQLGDELLAAEEDDAPITGATAAVVVERDARQNRQGPGRGAPERRPRNLN
jgi:hypothetical protein